MRAGVTMSIARFLWLAAVSGCAVATSASVGNDAAVDHKDAHVVVTIDSPRAIDASPLQDSSPLIDAPPPDAAPEPLICNSNPECTTPGDCCFSLGGPGFCVPGTIVITVCVPK
jgi:hypothetical protein